MKISSLLTSAGINIGLCVLFLSLYSVLRKQPANVRVYFGRRIAEEHDRLQGALFWRGLFHPLAGLLKPCGVLRKRSWLLLAWMLLSSIEF
jgi:hypothetical protein